MLIVYHEKLKCCLLCKESASLYLFDAAQIDHLLIWLCVGELPLEEEDSALFFLFVVEVSIYHVVEEDQLIVGHHQHSLLIAQRVKNLTRTFNYLLAFRLLVQEELLLQIGDVLPLQILLLDGCESLAEMLHRVSALCRALFDSVPLRTCI